MNQQAFNNVTCAGVNLPLFVPLLRLILKVLSQYRADCKVTMVGLRALALLLRSGK